VALLTENSQLNANSALCALLPSPSNVLDFLDIFPLSYPEILYPHFHFLVLRGPKFHKSGSANGKSQIHHASFQSIWDIRKLLESF